MHTVHRRGVQTPYLVQGYFLSVTIKWLICFDSCINTDVSLKKKELIEIIGM